MKKGKQIAVNSIEAIQRILGEMERQNVTTNLHHDGDFDVFVKVKPEIAIYVFKYDLDGMGIGVRQYQKNISSFWNLRDFGPYETEERLEDLVSVFLEIFSGKKYFKILNDKPMTSYILGDSSYSDYSIFEVIERCQEFSQ